MTSFGDTLTRVRVEKPKEKKPKLEDTDASSYFGTSNKIKRTAAPPPRKPPPTKKKRQEDDDFVVDDDEFDFDEDVMQEIENSQPAKVTTSTNGTKKGNATPTPTKTATATVKDEPKITPTKRKAAVVKSDDEDEFLDPKPAPKTSTRTTPKKPKPAIATAKKESPAPKKTPPKLAPAAKLALPKAPPKTTPKAAKKEQNEDAEGDLQRKAILESVEKVDLPDIAAPSGDTKFNFRAMAARPGPQAAGSKEIPVGNEDCLTVNTPLVHSDN